MQLFIVHVGLLTLSHIIYACDAPEIIPYSFSCIKLESHDEFLQLSTLTTVVVTPDRRPYFSSESIHLEFSTQTSLTIPLRITTSCNNLFSLIPPAHFSLPLTRIFKLSLTLNHLFPLGFYTLCPCSSCFFVEFPLRGGTPFFSHTNLVTPLTFFYQQETIPLMHPRAWLELTQNKSPLFRHIVVTRQPTCAAARSVGHLSLR
ncbi:hypothetical protein F2Q69_00037851 [Brassica cretica]|uniref:Uncharacterized protein n=1 Tax=Brassica cretica TaxID=69181 RepID=A0A8S9SJQ4_BRACR|nr:hypothetical protein F2Q69_00037851 [Brassica cretica]